VFIKLPVFDYSVNIDTAPPQTKTATACAIAVFNPAPSGAF